MKIGKISLIIVLLIGTCTVFAQTKVNTVVFVHGAFADGSSWSKVIPILKKNGINSVTVQNPLTSLADDVTATDRVIQAQDKNVILVGHSWGGTVITEAGNNEKVLGLVYVAALAPDANQSSNETRKDYKTSPGSKDLIVDKFGYAWLTDESMMTNFAQDLTAQEHIVMTATQGPIKTKAFDDKVSVAAWKNKPSWFIVASDDRMIDPTYQRDMAKKMNSKTTSLQASHVPMLSKPQEVANVIIEAVKSANKPMKVKQAQEE